MINQSIFPHEALRGFVKEYLIVHFELKGISKNREKVFPPRPDTSIIFYPGETFRKINPVIDKIIDIPHSATPEEISKAMTQFNHSFVGPPLTAK